MSVPIEYLDVSQLPPGYAEAQLYTSPNVLTLGVQQGWADPIDPRAVDFSERPTIFGVHFMDPDGYAMNPYGTRGMYRGQGELGKHGPNKAEECLVVARDGDGRRKILLSKRTDKDELWSLPGGMDKPGKGSTAKRELHEETGIMAVDTPDEELYEWYANDWRNTWNSWIETKGVGIFPGTVLQARPDGDGGKEISRNAWFDLPETIDELLEHTGPLFASHTNGVQFFIEHDREIHEKLRQKAREASEVGNHRQMRLLQRAASGILFLP